MKVLLTGATGYIGGAVADRLARGGHDVVALVRSSDAEARVRERGFRPVMGDIADAQLVGELARAADAVIHAATNNSAEMATIDTNLVAAVLDALAGSDKPFIYTSGIWSLGNTTSSDETSDANPIPLVAWRIPIEEQVLAGATRGVRTMVMRPAIVHGRGGGILEMFVKEAREKGFVRVIDDGTNRWPGVHADDLAELYVMALERAPAGTMLHASSPSMAVHAIAKAASIAGGAGGKTEAWPLVDARKELGGFADALALDQVVSDARTRELLNWKPTRPDALAELTAQTNASG